MGKISLKDVSVKNIENCLKHDKREISTNWVVATATINVFLFLIEVFVSKCYEIKCVSLLLCIIVLGTFCFFWKKHTEKKNLYLFCGIYTCLFAISFSLVSYEILNAYIGEDAKIVLLIDSILDAIVFVSSIVLTIRKIQRDEYKNHLAVIATTGITASGVIAGRVLRENIGIEIFSGYALAILGIVLVGQSSFFVRYMCINIIEKKET